MKKGKLDFKLRAPKNSKWDNFFMDEGVLLEDACNIKDSLKPNPIITSLFEQCPSRRPQT